MDYLIKEFPCRICGKFTNTWVELDLSTQTCTCCTECLKRDQEINPPALLNGSLSSGEQAFADYQPEFEEHSLW